MVASDNLTIWRGLWRSWMAPFRRLSNHHSSCKFPKLAQQDEPMLPRESHHIFLWTFEAWDLDQSGSSPLFFRGHGHLTKPYPIETDPPTRPPLTLKPRMVNATECCHPSPPLCTNVGNFVLEISWKIISQGLLPVSSSSSFPENSIMTSPPKETWIFRNGQLKATGVGGATSGFPTRRKTCLKLLKLRVCEDTCGL